MTTPEPPDPRMEDREPSSPAPPPPPPPFAKSWAVVIGINEYGEGIPTLLNAVNDAEKVASTLRERHGYEVIKLIDKEASLERVKELLYKELPAKVQDDHRVLFYWAGHGLKTESDSGPDGYLLPSDARKGKKATYLHMPGVHDALLDLRCRHMMVVLDTCFSGAFRWSGMRDIGREEGEVVQWKKYYRFVEDPAWQVISSASMDQKAADELPIGSRGGDAENHSPFALALFQGLDGKADVMGGEGGGGDGLVTAHELYLYIDHQLARATKDKGVGQKAQLWPLKKHDKGEFIFQVDELKLAPDPVLTYENNPWLGLRSYEEFDADLFFGRKTQIGDLLERVEENSLTVVFGASGTGKSSLVKAGLIPRLRSGGWHVLPVMRPGASPLKALRQALDPDYTMTATLEVPSVTAAHPRPAASEVKAGTAARRRAADDIQRSAIIQALVTKLLAEHEQEKVALVIDRFEELITLSSSARRDAFLKFLKGLLDEHDRLRLVVTVRSDFEAKFNRTDLADLWNREECRFKVDPMSREDLRKVIEMPAAKRVLYFNPSSLVEKLIDEVATTPGALPLLSFALSQMYRDYLERPDEDRAITEEHYARMGGVVGALRKRADEVYSGLGDQTRPSDTPPSNATVVPSPLQRTAKHLMLRMVVREGGHMAGRRVADAELDFPDEEENARCETVVERLGKEGLLVRGSEHGEPFVEPAHDALVREWEQLQTWVREEDEAAISTAPAGRRSRGVLARSSDKPYTLEQRQRLARAAGEWEDADKKTRAGLVWSDRVRSTQLASLVTPRASWVNKRELAFAERSIHRRRRTVALRNTAWLVIGLLTGTSIAYGVRATVLAALATSRQLAAEMSNALVNGELDHAALLAVEASALPAPDIRSPLLTWQLTTPKLLGYLRDTVPVTAVALSPDGNTIAAAHAPGPGPAVAGPDPWRVKASKELKSLWLGVTGRWGDRSSQIPPPEPCKDRTVSTVVLWGAASRTVSDTLCGHGGRVVSLAYGGPNSTPTLAVATDSGPVHVFDVNKLGSQATLRDTLPGDTAQVTALAFGAGGGLLALARANRVILWDLQGQHRLRGRRDRRQTEPQQAHPGKETEAIAREDPLKAPSRSMVIDSLIEGKSRVRSITFTPTIDPNIQTLASVTDSGITMWRITHRFRVVGKDETLWSIADSSSRWQKIYQRSRSEEFTQPHWIYPGDTLDMGFATRKLRSLPMSNVASIAFSPDRGTFAVARRDTMVILWNVATGQPRDTLGGHTGGATSVAFRPNAKDGSMILAAATADGTVILWDVTQKGNPQRGSGPLHGHSDAVTSLAFGPDGQTLLSASEDGKVIVWDVTRRIKFTSDTPAIAASWVRWKLGPRPGGAYSVVRSSADSNTMAAAYMDGNAILWNVAQQGDSLVPIDSLGTLSGGGVTSVAFSPRDSTSVASAHADGKIVLWAVTDSGPKQMDMLLRKGSGAATSVAFSPDSNTIASAYEDGTIVRWNVISGRRLGSSRGHTDSVWSLAFSPDARTLASAGADSAVMLWDVENMRRRGQPLRGHFRSLAFSPDPGSTTLAAADDSGSVTVLDFQVDSMKRAACDAAGRNLSQPEWDASFRKRYERACSDYPGLSPVSGEGWRERGVNAGVRRLANEPGLLNFLGTTWMWIWFPILLPWAWLWWKGRPLRRSSRMTA